MQGHHDATEGQVIDMQVLDKRAPIKRSPVLGEQPEEAFHQRIELAFAHVELRFVQHRLRDVRDELRRPADAASRDDRLLGAFRELHMVVIRGFGEAPMMLLTSLPVSGTFESMWRVVEAYLSRWRIEETIRFVKQSYKFENIASCPTKASAIWRP